MGVAPKHMLHLRPYQHDDFLAVWDLHNLSLTQARAHGGNGPWDDDLRAIPDIYLRDNGAFVVGLVDERIVAMGALKRISETEAEVKRMRVHPDFQRRGYGQQVLSHLEAKALDLGYLSLRLDTTTAQKAALSLYAKNGYSEVGRRSWREFEMVYFIKHLL